MAQANRTGFWARSIRFSVTAMVAALLGAATVVHAAVHELHRVRNGRARNQQRD